MGRFRVRLTDEQLAFRDRVYEDTRVKLTPVETTIVHRLMQCLGRTVAHDVMADAVWPDDDGWEGSLFSERIRVHVCRARQKLGPAAEILTSWGQGYSMIRLGKPTSKGE